MFKIASEITREQKIFDCFTLENGISFINKFSKILKKRSQYF